MNNAEDVEVVREAIKVFAVELNMGYVFKMIKALIFNLDGTFLNKNASVKNKAATTLKEKLPLYLFIYV